MKYVFVADDRIDKLRDISVTMKRMFPDAEVRESQCVNQVLYDIHCMIKDDIWDDVLVVTDMQMPIRPDDGFISLTGGRSVISELARRGAYCPVIVVSSEGVLDSALKKIYQHYAGSVLWNRYMAQDAEYRSLLDEYYRVFPE